MVQAVWKVTGSDLSPSHFLLRSWITSSLQVIMDTISSLELFNSNYFYRVCPPKLTNGNKRELQLPERIML